MKISEQTLFESTGTITPEELTALYGPMLKGDLVLKLAEHKNFNEAREQFNTWKEGLIIETANLLGQDYRHAEQLYKTKDKYLAVTFLKALLNEWEEDRQEKIKFRMEDPIQQQKAAELLKIRLAGKLPHIDLAGTDFTVDWRLKEMRETELPWKNISFDDLEMDDHGDNYLCFFDTEIHELYMPPGNLLKLPDNVVVLEIPNEVKLDPVAVARQYGSDLNELLKEHPIQETLKAKLWPLSESGLPEIIENNIRMQEQADDKQRKRGR